MQDARNAPIVGQLSDDGHEQREDFDSVRRGRREYRARGPHYRLHGGPGLAGGTRYAREESEPASRRRGLAAYDPKDFAQQPKVRERIGIFEHMGRATAEQLAYAREMLEFLRACAGAAWGALRTRGTVRWGEVLDVATEAGANAVPIVLLIGFLMGVIIAFEIGLVAQQRPHELISCKAG
jgi:hypothetical protein